VSSEVAGAAELQGKWKRFGPGGGAGDGQVLGVSALPKRGREGDGEGR